MLKRLIRPISKEEFTLKTSEGFITFLLGRSRRRRTIAIYVDEKAMVTVYCPAFVAEKEIFSFVKDKAKWIFDKIDDAKQKDDYLKNRSFDDGSDFLFLGKKCRLVINPKDIKDIKLDFDGTKFVVIVPLALEGQHRKQKIKNKLIKWYRAQALEILGGRVFHFSRIMGVEPKKISIRTQKRTWGNCYYNAQAINLNWQIILSPMDVIDYIVVHELCHLTVPNHSKRFWARVEKVLPEYKKQKQWLKTNCLDMVLV